MPHNRVRGPYKQYEIDTNLSVPRSTLFEKSKRHFAEVEDDNPVFVAVREELDGSDCHIQVRLDKFQIIGTTLISVFDTSSSRYIQNNYNIYMQLNDSMTFLILKANLMILKIATKQRLIPSILMLVIR